MTRQIPVKVFRSSDAGAPVLEGVKGSLNILLKTCLVTGYGDKQPLGWEVVAEKKNQTAFSSRSLTSKKHCLIVNHHEYTHAAQIHACQSMTDWDNKVDVWGGTDEDFYTAVAYRSEAMDWVLVGHDKAFVLAYFAPSSQYAGLIYFGDVPSLLAGDESNVMLFRSVYSSSSISSSALMNSYSRSYPYFYRHYQTGVLNEKYTFMSALGETSYGVFPVFNKTSEIQYFATPIYLKSEPIFRAAWPGMMAINIKPHEGIFDMNITGLEDYIHVHFKDKNSSLLINKKSWEAV